MEYKGLLFSWLLSVCAYVGPAFTLFTIIAYRPYEYRSKAAPPNIIRIIAISVLFTVLFPLNIFYDFGK